MWVNFLFNHNYTPSTLLYKINSVYFYHHKYESKKFTYLICYFNGN